MRTNHILINLIFFLNDTATTEIYTLSLHDALPISGNLLGFAASSLTASTEIAPTISVVAGARSEEHTSELQSQSNLVCRLLLEKKKKLNYLYRSYSYELLILLFQLTSSYDYPKYHV